MRIAALSLAMTAVALACSAGCAPRFPNDLDHQVESPGCPECHFDGEATQAPASHGDGAGNVNWEHESCLSCHRPT